MHREKSVFAVRSVDMVVSNTGTNNAVEVHKTFMECCSIRKAGGLEGVTEPALGSRRDLSWLIRPLNAIPDRVFG